MPVLNLSTVSGQLGNFLCDCDMDDCNGHCADYLMSSPKALTLIGGDDKSKGDDGDKDGPFNDIVAHLDRCLEVTMGDDDEIPTVKQLTAIESIAEWIAWSKGETLV
jgi:hypothetical protein